MKFDVICFGALNIDRLYQVNRIAGRDEESFITDFKEAPGGSAANTAVGLARLGLRTGFIGKVSDSHEGKLLLNDFKRQNVDTNGTIISKEGDCGIAMAYVDAKGDRALYAYPGVNDTLESKEVDLEYARKTEFLHLTSFIGTKPFDAQKELVRELNDVRVSLDPGELHARRGLAALKPLLEKSAVTLPSENEVRLLTGKNYVEGSKILIKEGASIVAVKLGERGCYVTDEREKHLLKPYKVKVVDTTGAGDAFCAGFLYGVIRNRDLYECGRLGNFVASRCIEKAGAREGLPSHSDLKDIELKSAL
ncbi:MAG: carbohydrate kinase family protein [Candidatus Bathyarchaeota archaeon]|nr:MAG: carbohydrate kinase family protein [Candidatus Bathyarchaeota archaeon]